MQKHKRRRICSRCLIHWICKTAVGQERSCASILSGLIYLAQRPQGGRSLGVSHPSKNSIAQLACWLWLINLSKLSMWMSCMNGWTRPEFDSPQVHHFDTSSKHLTEPHFGSKNVSRVHNKIINHPWALKHGPFYFSVVNNINTLTIFSLIWR